MKVKANVHVLKDGYSVFLRAGDTVPEGVTITNPDVIDVPTVSEAPAAETEDEPAPAPKRTSRKADSAS